MTTTPTTRASAPIAAGAAGSACHTTSVWPRERVLFALAGTATLLGAALAALVSPWFLLMTAAIGANQLLLVATGLCPASMVIDRVLARRAR